MYFLSDIENYASFIQGETVNIHQILPVLQHFCLGRDCLYSSDIEGYVQFIQGNLFVFIIYCRFCGIYSGRDCLYLWDIADYAAFIQGETVYIDQILQIMHYLLREKLSIFIRHFRICSIY